MSYLFDHLDLIRGLLTRSPFGLATDVDGTISKTAPTPQEAKVSPLCRRYLSLLCNHLPLVAAISGRPAITIKNMIKIEGMVYVGNHGLEQWIGGHIELAKDAQGYLRMVKDAIEELTPLLSLECIRIEDKGITASIHYRLCPDPQSAEKHILTTLEALPQTKGLRIVKERMAIDLIPPVKANKGTAVLDLIRKHNLRSGIYLGDDLTDIDAFRAMHDASYNLDFQGFAIGISSQEMPDELVSEADFTLNGVNDVQRFLKWMSLSASEPS